MSLAFEFVWDSRQLEVWRGSNVEGALVKALRLAGNQALRSMQKDSATQVTNRKLMKTAEVLKGLPLVFPSRKEAIRALVWRENVSGKAVQLASFPHIQTAKGVSVRVNVSGKTTRIKSAFVTSVRGHSGIFMRRGKRRLPIHELFTTRISEVMQDEGVITAVQSAAYAKLQSAFAKGLDRELGKLKKKGVF